MLKFNKKKVKMLNSIKILLRKIKIAEERKYILFPNKKKVV